MKNYRLLNEGIAIEYTINGETINLTTEQKIQYEIFGLPNVAKSQMEFCDEIAVFTAKNRDEAFIIAKRYMREFGKHIPKSQMRYELIR